MIDLDQLDWEKQQGLLPAIVQDAATGEVRMLGYMNKQALETTLRERQVTFFSRSRQQLWRKGETSGNTLELVDLKSDCDGDALLITARVHGPTCHTGTSSCFGEDQTPEAAFLLRLEAIIKDRAERDPEQSYTASLLSAGIKRVAQKVGEEAVETVLAAAAGDPDELAAEAADLVYHLTVLLHAGGSSWGDVLAILNSRHNASLATAAS